MVMMRELLLGWQNLMFHFVLSKSIAKIFSIGRLIDVFLTLVARDENLGAKSFQSLAEAFQKMLGIVMTTSIEPWTCIPRYRNFFRS